MDMNGMRTLLTGRGLLESPRWRGDRLYFSDWSAGEVVAVDLAGRSEVIAEVASLPLCTAWLPDGRLVIVFSPDGRLLRLEPGGSLVTHADLGQPGWNDIVADGHGHIYVNRAGFNPVAGEAFQPGSVYRASADGPARQVTDDIAFPQRDGGHRRQLHPDRGRLLLAPAGRIRHRRRWRPIAPAGLGRPGRGHPGWHLCRRPGAVWYADVPNRRCVRVAEGGAVLGTVDLDRGGFACALGGPSRTTAPAGPRCSAPPPDGGA
jgi:sugar lactone lactonase YvrE